MSKRLITDRDVATGAVRPPLVLGADTLITPSARDRAAQLGWAIVEEGSATPGAASVTGSSSARLDTLADGLYLVRIEGGQMVSALPASGPGLMQRADGARRAAGAAITSSAASPSSGSRA